MARRKAAAPPAPWSIRIFWGLAIAVAVVLGPLLLMRADWMWGSGPSTTAPSATPADEAESAAAAEAVQIRLKIDLLQGKPWVVHLLTGSARAASVSACLSAERGWQPAGPSAFVRRLEREGAPVDLFAVLEEAADDAQFLQFVSGRQSEAVGVEGYELSIGAGARAHVVGFFTELGAPDPTLTPSPVPQPAPRGRDRAAFVVGDPGWRKAIAAAGAYPLALKQTNGGDDATCAWLSDLESWLIGVPPSY